MHKTLYSRDCYVNNYRHYGFKYDIAPLCRLIPICFPFICWKEKNNGVYNFDSVVIHCLFVNVSSLFLDAR